MGMLHPSFGFGRGRKAAVRNDTDGKKNRQYGCKTDLGFAD
jgi:hypothetical protein